MSRSMEDDFTYFVKILDENGDRFYLKSSIDERTNTILIQLTNLELGWSGALNQHQVRILAKQFPPEEHDSFYSHTQRAFSHGNHVEADGRQYVFNCKTTEKNRLEFVWKQLVDDLNSLKIIGHAELQERPMGEILSKMMDHAIDEIGTLKSINEEKLFDIQRINGQLNKALETVKQTVDMKEKLEGDLYRKFVLVLNSKKNELNKLKRQLESYEHNKDTHGADDEVIHAGYHSGTDDERSSDAFANLRERSRSPVQTTASLNDLDRSPGGAGKRSKYATSDTDTSGDDEPFVDDEVQHMEVPLHPASQSMDNLLDLGDDRTDYKSSTRSVHHQRRKYVTGVNSISTRPFLSHAGAGIPPTLTTPSLPEDSQTTEDLLERI